MRKTVSEKIPVSELKDILEPIHELTGLTAELIDSGGKTVMRFGNGALYCDLVGKQLISERKCFFLHKKSGECALEVGGAYIFSCHANMNIITLPITDRGKLTASVIIGPFLLDKPDSTIVSDYAEAAGLSVSESMELYDSLTSIPVIAPDKLNHLKRLLDRLLLSVNPGEGANLLQNRQRLYQQSRINETIQVYKEQNMSSDLRFLYEKEKDLLSKVKTGDLQEIKGMLNELLGRVLFSEGGAPDNIRVRAIELTTLLSRVAIDGGAKADSMYDLNSKFISQLYSETEIDAMCDTLQEVAESFMSAMLYGMDKGNPHMRKALQYISDNYNRSLTLNEVAEYVSLSPNYFSTLFKRTVGESFRDHLNRVRIEESRLLLSSTDYSLADIAAAMGFADQSSFCKVFKRITGTTPGKYRQ